MSNLLVAFFTGLTTGGLSCLAVQGGLLASSLAQDIEKGYQPRPKHSKWRSNSAPAQKSSLPILLFLGAKVTAYTVLGFLLGWVGSMLQLSPIVRAILLIGIGVFMLGNALRMLNAHPIFRYFVIEPPRFLTRYIRRKSKNGDSHATPLFLGALTVLIPCGVTQAMMAVAMGTGNPLQGAAIMFAFTLGTSPVFFLVAFLATQIGARLESWFLRFTAIVVLVMGLVSVNSGLTLAGSPLSVTNLFQSAAPATPAAASNALTLAAQNNGYSPTTLYAKAGMPVSLTLVTDKTSSCARSFVIPSLGIQKVLPETGSMQIKLSPQSAGKTIYFSCSMGMYSGWILFEA